MKQYDGITGSEDDTLTVDCECGERPFIGSFNVYRCKCGRGYRTEMTVWQYGVNEDDVRFANKKSIDQWEQ